MGQALCAAVRGEGMPHKASPVGPVVTICVGVSWLTARFRMNAAVMISVAPSRFNR